MRKKDRDKPVREKIQTKPVKKKIQTKPVKKKIQGKLAGRKGEHKPPESDKQVRLNKETSNNTRQNRYK